MEPFLQPGSAIEAKHLQMRSWRYFVEINSGCNLSCPTCARGNKEGYEQKIGKMTRELYLKVLEKIRNENNEAIVFLYGNSEPFLNPELSDYILDAKRMGLRCEFSTNLNYMENENHVMNSGPDLITISVSGWSQEVYERGHRGGRVENVKSNMRKLSETRRGCRIKPPILVTYHLYKDNDGDELEAMREYAAALEFDFQTCIARAISMENVLQYLMEREAQRTGTKPQYLVLPGFPDYNQMLPPVNDKWRETMQRLRINPDEAVSMYEKFKIHPVCPVGDAFTYIRHDGLVSMCCCVDDRRLNFGNYLEKSQEELSAMRRGHPICQQCLKYRMNLYFHIADKVQWDAKKP